MRILVLKSKSMCYNSTFYFADCAAEALKMLGHEVVVFEFGGKSLEQIQQLASERFDGIIDFNSKVPQALDDATGHYYLDEFHAPFYNYILDHPLYHHDNLKEKLRDYHVICLDEDHAAYIRNYYPWIKDVIVLPLGAMPLSDGDITKIPHKSRKYDLLFTGTYTAPRSVLEIINQCDKGIRNDIMNMIDILKADLSLRIEDALDILLQRENRVLPKPRYAECMQLYFLADTYITAGVRSTVIQSLADSGIVLDVFGHGWKYFQCENRHNIRYHGECDFRESFRCMADARAVLNIMPWFKNGAHDRIFSAMKCGAVSITDESGYIDRFFTEDKDIITYSLKDMDGLVKKLEHLRSDCEWAEMVAERGRLRVEDGFTWRDRMKTITERM